MRTPHPTRLAIALAALALPVLPSPAHAAPATPSSGHGTSAAATRAAATSTRQVTVPRLVARAQLSADYLAPGPESGAKATAANGRKGPFAGQVIPGFSAVVEGRGGHFYGMPDNGFGAKSNSSDFLLRIYDVTPNWETAKTAAAPKGVGGVTVNSFIALRDPNHNISWSIVNESSRKRLLTGADFDIESLVMAKDGSFWIGEEFGPYLLHFGHDGVLLQAPVPLPVPGSPAGPDQQLVKSPSNPTLADGEVANLRNSKGFEGMAASRSGRYLYPILEGYLNGDDKRTRDVNQFDTRLNRYTGRTWKYQVDTDDNLVADAFMQADGSMLVLERDDFWGAKAVTRRVYRVRLGQQEADGFLRKTLVADLLKIDNPGHIGMVSDKGAYGVGDPFSFPFQSVETIVQLRNGRFLTAVDNNYPGNDARRPGTPDNTEMIEFSLARKTVPAAPANHIVFAHRGASGYRPEHTLAAYELAIQQCADYIEPDLVMTKDGYQVDRHEPEISGTTDVASHPEFASRKTTKMLDGVPTTGWFTEDFTLAELRTLHAKERLPQIRPANTKFDGLYPIPTFDEVVDLARHSRTCDGKPVGVIPEIKHSTYFATKGLKQEQKTVATLESDGYGRRNSPVVIQSFEVNNLKELNAMTPVHLVQLVDCGTDPYDQVVQGTGMTYKDMVSAAGLRRIAKYADSVGLCKDLMIPKKADGSLDAPTSVIRDAHAAGLQVTGWTFRRENNFLPTNFQSSKDPAQVGDLAGEIRTFLAAGMDNVFSDNPDVAVQAVRDFSAGK